MYARWLVAAESLAVAAVLYCANMADSAEYVGPIIGLDGPPETELRILWRLRASEVFLLLVALWIVALLLAYGSSRSGNNDEPASKYGSSFTIGAAIVVPIAFTLTGWVLGITRYLGFGSL
jgi:hypothetical protein